MSPRRLLVAIALIGATAVLAAIARQPVAAAPLQIAIPYAIGSWRGGEAEPLDPATERALAADVLVNRTYEAVASPPIGFYLAYYREQRPGVSIHAPLHCLPGTGWDILSDETAAVEVPGAPGARVRRVVAHKAHATILILYWYAIHGRMIASDAASRLQLLTDRVRLGRNDGALVRLVVPVVTSEEAAEREALAFMRAVVPHLPGYRSETT